MKTDTSLRFEQFPTAVHFFTTRAPSVPQVQEVSDMGEHIPLVLKSSNPDNAEDWYGRIQGIISPIYIWVHDPQKTPAQLLQDEYFLKERIPRLASINTQLKLIMEKPVGEVQISPAVRSLLRQYGVSLIETSSMLELTASPTIYEQQRMLESYKDEAKQYQYPILSVALSEDNVQWLITHLPDIKKSGILIRPLP